MQSWAWVPMDSAGLVGVFELFIVGKLHAGEQDGSGFGTLKVPSNSNHLMIKHLHLSQNFKWEKASDR